MAHVKTAISLDKSLYTQLEELAQQMSIPRSQLFAIALQEFIKRHQNRHLLEQINQAYSDPPDVTEQANLTHMKHKQRQRMEAEGRW